MDVRDLLLSARFQICDFQVCDVTGRRFRTFLRLLHNGYPIDGSWLDPDWTYGQVYDFLRSMAAVDRDPHYLTPATQYLGLRLFAHDYPDGDPHLDQPYAGARPRDPELHPALQDLADEITEDIHEALDTLDNPSHYYAGVDDGIEPVPDEHVAFVIWALQRELDRELRPPVSAQPGTLGGHHHLPPAPLAELSPAVQRALAERRRYRYLQYGIGREQWLAGRWSLWDVHEDPDWLPRRRPQRAG